MTTANDLNLRLSTNRQAKQHSIIKRWEENKEKPGKDLPEAYDADVRSISAQRLHGWSESGKVGAGECELDVRPSELAAVAGRTGVMLVSASVINKNVKVVQMRRLATLNSASNESTLDKKTEEAIALSANEDSPIPRSRASKVRLSRSSPSVSAKLSQLQSTACWSCCSCCSS